MIYFALSILFAVLFAYPYLIYPQLLRFLPEVPLQRAAGAVPVSFTLVFCAYNEERSLPEKIANLRMLKARYPDLDILGYSDMSSDRTLAILEEASDILTPVAATERAGKAAGMRRLVAMAQGDVVIFTDANVTLDPEAIDNLGAYFADPKVGTVAGRLVYVNESDSATAAIGSAYWSQEERLKAAESRTGSTMGADGSIFAMRRTLYPAVPPHLLDDLTASINPLFSGYRVITASDVVAYERLTTLSSDEFRRKRRISCRAFNTHRYLAPKLRSMAAIDRFKYVSHKYLRWMGSGFLLLSAMFAFIWVAVSVNVLVALFLLVSVGGILAVLYAREIGPARKLIEIALAITATGWGVIESLQGKTYQTWTPALSRDRGT